MDIHVPASSDKGCICGGGRIDIQVSASIDKDCICHQKWRDTTCSKQSKMEVHSQYLKLLHIEHRIVSLLYWDIYYANIWASVASQIETGLLKEFVCFRSHLDIHCKKKKTTFFGDIQNAYI